MMMMMIIIIIITKYIYYGHSKVIYNKNFYVERYKENITDFEKQS